MNLTFTLDEDDDILNTTIRDSETGSVAYSVVTSKHTGGPLTTTVRRQNQVYGSSRFLFRIFWKGTRGSLEDVVVVLDFRTRVEIPVRQILKCASGSSTYGSVLIDNAEYRWKSKGTGSKVVLVNQESDKTVAQSHSRRRSSFFQKPRDMSLEILEPISHAVDTVLLTFILVWRERHNERSKNACILVSRAGVPPLSHLLAEE